MRMSNLSLTLAYGFGLLIAVSYFVSDASPVPLELVHHHQAAAGKDDLTTIIILGATGDLAKRSLYPSLWNLFKKNRLPINTRIIGYARSRSSVDEIRRNVEAFVKITPEEAELYDEFWSKQTYVSSANNDELGYRGIDAACDKFETERHYRRADRVFYMSLPPKFFANAATNIKRYAMPKRPGQVRIAVEKPFGSDSETSAALAQHLDSLFKPEQIFIMDHFLGYDMVQNLVTLRFENHLFDPVWNRDNIEAVSVLFEEAFGIEGRGAFFDANGIIRDVVQNHLLQLVALLAMERPVNGNIREAKVELLKAMRPVEANDTVLGQYLGDPEAEDPKKRVGYREDPTVKNKESTTPTFASTVLKIDNDRWAGVPFIVRAGKALGRTQTTLKIQFKDEDPAKRDELEIKLKGETISMNLNSKIPGILNESEKVKLNFVYADNYKNVTIPRAYERLFYEIINDEQQNFVKEQELVEAWRIFTPVLRDIDNGNNELYFYKWGTPGPVQADELEKHYGYYTKHDRN
ncbi:glucose-6-phosphate 1-dehydrogenase-like [Trichogramma pretiosum]|uniref:glucose-6-phosphate 1-dehydrogenase-like n=1 Tax=Trichogramma pretiosum TaxID=7493 RepID=UPI0006C997E5|nr:glucose-6-phosphate 1-dehydrogenase-like [Trichogramma pretiosum]